VSNRSFATIDIWPQARSIAIDFVIAAERTPETRDLLPELALTGPTPD